MARYKALIRYEWKSLRWMMIYFLLVAIGGVGLIASTMAGKRFEFIKHMGVWEIQTLFNREMNWSYGLVVSGLILGILMLVYTQFRDAKSIEVGRFLKMLPIKSTGIYWTRVGCGILTYTVPFILFMIGNVYVRMHNNDWLMDYYSLSQGYSILVKMESIPSILGHLGLMYLIITAIYLGVLVMQYLISNRIFALVMGVVLFMVPTYLMIILSYMMSGYADPRPGFIPIYGVRTREYSQEYENGERFILHYVDNQGIKVLVLLGIIICMLVIGYSVSKRFRVEDQGKLIPMKASRTLFTAIGTVCIAFIPYQLWTLRMVSERDLGMGMMCGLIAVFGVIGYFIMRKISMIGMKGN
ncbi:MAG: hypothetical protein ACRCW2_00045 [Cellulosilyticaceae bacterium]